MGLTFIACFWIQKRACWLFSLIDLTLTLGQYIFTVHTSPWLTSMLYVNYYRLLFDSASTPRLVFYSLITVFLSLTHMHWDFHTYAHYIINSHSLFYLNLRMMVWSHRVSFFDVTIFLIAYKRKNNWIRKSNLKLRRQFLSLRWCCLIFALVQFSIFVCSGV